MKRTGRDSKPLMNDDAQLEAGTGTSVGDEISTGIVIKWSKERGCGFIEPDEGGDGCEREN